jgi:hypothetical protein
VDRVVAAVIPEGIQGAASAQKRGFKTILKAGRHGDVPGTNSMRAKSQYLLEINEEKRGWLKTHITHLLQSMEIPAESLPGKVPCTGSLQEGHAESSTRQRNLHTPIQHSKGSATTLA